MKKYLFISFLILATLPITSYAQNQSDLWAVFEPQNQINAEQPEFILTSIVARDDRVEITGRANNWEKAVVTLEMDIGNGNVGLCSGSMIDSNIVLTAAHCLSDNGHFVKGVNVFAVGISKGSNKKNKPSEVKPKKSKISLEDISKAIEKLRNKSSEESSSLPKDTISNIVDSINMNIHNNNAKQNYISNSFNINSYISATATQLWVPDEYLRITKMQPNNFYEAERYDYGIVILDTDIGEQTGWLSIAKKSDAQLNNADIIVLGRPGDKAARSLWRAEGHVGVVDEDFFYYDADVLGGNSGGPIFDAKEPGTIIGLCNFGSSLPQVPFGYPNGGLRINNQIINAVNAQRNQYSKK